jgi:5'-nucleotidase
LKGKGVEILIAVGHAGYLKDMEIAEKVPDIDVVVGGHTNTFLWNGNKYPHQYANDDNSSA